MWQDLKKSGGYWEAPGRQHQGTLPGSLSEEPEPMLPLMVCKD